MFQIRSGQIVAILLLLSVGSQPMLSYASEASAFAAVPASAPSPNATNQRVKDLSFEQVRDGTKAKLSNAQQWVKDKTYRHDAENPLKVLEVKIDRLQDDVKPIGRSIKSSVKKHARGAGILQKGDQMFTMFGFLLFAAFGLICVLMSLSSPSSRLGGRH